MSNSNGTIAPELSMPEFYDPPAEPIGLYNRWYERAVEHGVQEANALAFATVDERGRAWSRMIRVIEVSEEGLLFATHAHSQKGRDLATTPWASGVLYWPELKQQVILGGPVSRLSDEKSDELWYRRPPATNAISVVARQSDPLDDEDALRAEARRLADRGEQLPRPNGFGAYRMALHAIEFWHDGTERLHLRLRYDWENGAWRSNRLHP
ncbi:phenazine biosynthesis FMN-dependent oxidase PhzG [Saccharopolyspora taberi]|uniref:Phenazine biosynthesis FMN-dependent oxidase PhzG n=1 Tax=Saccharopolyspora taberi TaxID=60895 RepID=A0ABN3VH48_9PSEU